jgi:hypothetical protein
MLFVLQLRNVEGSPRQWIQRLRGDVARLWYGVYRSSDWNEVRTKASCVFHNSVTEEQMNEVLDIEKRCIFIHTPWVKVEQLRRPPQRTRAFTG